MSGRFKSPATAGEFARIAGAGYEAVIAPVFGGRLVSCRHRGRPVVRETPPAVLAEPKAYGFAGFPLMPYSGPLFGHGFCFGGVKHRLDRNVPEEPTATHGDAWVNAFEVAHRDASSLVLTYDHRPREGAFPFRFRGTLRYGLSASGLTIGLEVRNLDHRLMPAGIGYHPYFPKPPGTRLSFDAVALWPPDAPEAVTLGCGPIEPGLDFGPGQDVSDIVADRLYEGWDGRAVIDYGDGARTVITAGGALDKLQLYSAWDYDYVCVEPVSNANDGFNRSEAGVPCHGVRVLEPGRTLEGAFSIAADNREGRA
jgi:aldose 1-epimerase